jgi:hypothetical protein
MRPLLLVPFFALAACGSPETNVRMSDAGADATTSDASSATTCDPHRAPCRVTLTCNDFASCEGLHLATGLVESFESAPPAGIDVSVYLGRYLGLSGSTSVCRFGTGTGSASFASLTEIPGDPSMCSSDMGAHLLCGVNTSSYTPTCVGDGLLVRDASMQLYRLRVIEDRNVGSLWQMEIEWSAID